MQGLILSIALTSSSIVRKGCSRLLILDRQGLQTLGILDRNGLDVAVQLLLGTILIVTLTRDAHAESVWHALDTLLPDLLVELRVEADVSGALS